MGLNADQRGGTSPNGKPSYTVDQAAAQLDRSGDSWSAALGEPATVTYAFRSTAPATLPDDASNFSRFNAAQIQAAQLSLEAWSDVANITFQRVGSGTDGEAAYSNAASILFADYSDTGDKAAAAFAFMPGDPAAGSESGDVWDNIASGDNTSPAVGNYGQQTLTHEIGHTIGLSHPSDYDASDSGPEPTYAANASYYEDSRQYSIMSYFASSSTGGQASIFAAAPQLDDIAAAQRLYGANYATRAGDTVYGFNSTADRPWYDATAAGGHIYAAIWDGGGDDTIDMSGYGQAQTIDLHAGAFSSVGGDIGNLAIAVGVTIENAIGGSGPDRLLGNAVANQLIGGAGNDTLSGGGGSDTLDGGSGDNTAIFAGFSKHYAVSLADGAGAVAGGTEGGTSSLTAIQNVQFTDGVLTFDVTSEAAEVYRLYDTFLNRAPDTPGLDTYLGYLDSGHTLAQAAAIAAQSPEFQAAAGSLTNAQFVAYVFGNALDRQPDAPGLAAYTAALDGGESRVDFALSVSESAEHVQHTAAAVGLGLWEPDVDAEGLALLYDTVLAREPDTIGLVGYEAELAGGTTFRQIANAAATSPEFVGRYGQLDDAHFVEAIYVNTLRRDVDPTGEAAYAGELSHGYTRGDVAWQIAISAEHQDLILGHPDPSLFTF